MTWRKEGSHHLLDERVPDLEDFWIGNILWDWEIEEESIENKKD